MKLKILLLLAISLNSCVTDGQKNPSKQKMKNEMIENFDTEVYKKTEYGIEPYVTPGGNVIYAMEFTANKGGSQKERLPPPSFYTIYKEFYANGNLKKREKYIGQFVKVDTSTYYSLNGSLEKQVNENEKFGKVKPVDILKFLQKKGKINMTTGEGNIDEDGRPLFTITFNQDEGKKIWHIILEKGKPNNNPENFPDIGEPAAYLPIIYKIDGETGDEIK